MSPQQMSFVIEAWLFANAQPMSAKDLRRLVRKGGFLAEVADSDGFDETEMASSKNFKDPQLDGEAPETEGVCADADGAAGDGVQEEARDDGEQEGGEVPEPFTLTSPPDGPRRPAISLKGVLREALAMLHLRWHDPDNTRGVQLVSIGDGLTFKTNPRYAKEVRVLREDKPPRLTRPALESLAIVAYRQPVTKPDIDHLRGVDSGGVVKMLLERGLIAVIGKREEPGRPLMYGTTPQFLQFFNLTELDALPSLKQFDELNDEAAQALRAFEGLPSLKELSEGATQIRLDDGAEAQDLEDVVEQLNRRESRARDAFMTEGVAFGREAGAQGTGETPTQH